MSLKEAEKATVVIILGGPGSGKGTQSDSIKKDFKFTHLSAGDLLRAERKTPGSQYGEIIEKYIVEGKIVPSEITVMLLEKAMNQAGFAGGRFLIDGFPRNIENLSTWQKIMNQRVNLPFLLFLECTEETMLQRLLKRGETSGRSDDNLESIKKRFVTFQQQTREIIKYYHQLKKCETVSSQNDPKVVFAEVTKVFQKYHLI